jgi:hypothetical protein
MDFEQLVDSLTPELYQNMKTAVEIGKWPDGTPLTEKQKEAAIQAVMLYDAKHYGDHDEPFRVKSDGSVELGKPQATQKLINDAQVIVRQPVELKKHP